MVLQLEKPHCTVILDESWLTTVTRVHNFHRYGINNSTITVNISPLFKG